MPVVVKPMSQVGEHPLVPAKLLEGLADYSEEELGVGHPVEGADVAIAEVLPGLNRARHPVDELGQEAADLHGPAV